MKTSKTKLLLWLSAFLVYLAVLLGYSTNWFKSDLTVEDHFVWWLIGVFFFISVLRMAIQYYTGKERKI